MNAIIGIVIIVAGVIIAAWMDFDGWGCLIFLVLLALGGKVIASD